MTEQEQIADLTNENTRLRSELQQALALIAQQAEEIAELKARLGRDSQNSSKPPASDGLNRRPRPPRVKGQKASGGQIGHPGHALQRVAEPDERVALHPATCQHCGEDLSETGGVVVERRQIFEMPPVRLHVTEYVQERVCCSHCHHETTGAFPAEASSLAQYGPRLRALAVYLRMQHLLPVERTAEVLDALCGACVSAGTVLAWEQEASQTVAPAVDEVRVALRDEATLHADETSLRIGTILHWVHVHATSLLTLLDWHRKRGQEGMRVVGVLPHVRGTVIHDRWESYWAFACRHALCHAHLQRDLQGIWETTGQSWATELQATLLAMNQAAHHWREQGSLPADELATWEAAFWQWIEVGEAANPLTAGRKHTAAQNLLRALRAHAPEVLAFLHDLTLPFTNNQAERDLRMLKVQQKIAGGCRTPAGATALCRLRSVISCLRKQGRDVLATLADLWAGQPVSLLPQSV
jgi:transposase